MESTPGEMFPPMPRRTVWAGVFCWAAVSIGAVLLRGVRWDENYEFAQVLLGVVPYPDGHPLPQYVHSFYSLQTWALAGVMAMIPGPLTPNLLRNVLFLMATVIPVFLLAGRLARSARWGHAAVLLVLMGVHVPFFSNYPVQVWPGMYSNGHIGLGWALLVLYLLSAGHHRTGYLMFGLMPAVHLGQFPPIFGVAVLRLVMARRNAGQGELRTAVRWGGLGLLFSAGFRLVQYYFELPPPAGGPYYSTVDAETIFRGYMTYFASHRSIPGDTGQMVIAGALLLAVAAARYEVRQAGAKDAWWWVGVYIGLVASIVWAIVAVHWIIGPDVPRWLIAWMPYRLINHLSPLLIPTLVAVLAARRNSAWVVLAALAYGCVRPACAVILPQDIYARYVADGSAAYFLLYGAAVVVLTIQIDEDRRFRTFWLGLVVLAWTVLAFVHQFGAVCALTGGIAAGVLTRYGRVLPVNAPLAALSAVLLLVLLVQQGIQREHLSVTPFEHAVRHYLAERGEPEAMILVRHQQETLQARLQHPVMTDMATITWIPYRPSLGPSLCKMYRDLYGIDLAPPPGSNSGSRPWFEVWPSKSLPEWQALAAEYNFRYVLAPAFMELPLPRVVKGKTDHLYHIPE